MSKLTSMTKEQREEIRDLIATAGISTFTVDASVMLKLMNDADENDSLSERLAAIEAVTGEEANSVIETIKRRGLLMEAIPVIFSLSAKVAEQAEEIERLRALSEGWHKDYSTQFRRAEAFETAYEDHLTGCAIERDTLERIGLVDESGEDNAGLWRNVRAEVAEAERDAIRAHMEGGNG